MDSIKETKNEKQNVTVGVTEEEGLKKDNPTDMKKFITKVDNRVKTKVRKAYLKFRMSQKPKATISKTTN